MKRSYFTVLIAAALTCFSAYMVAPAAVHADGMVEDEPVAKPRTRPAAPPPPPVVQEVPPPPPAPAPVEQRVAAPAPEPVPWCDFENCDWKFRLSPGVNVAFFDKHSNLPLPSLAFDAWKEDCPFNLRVGVELRHMYLHGAEEYQQSPDDATRVTYIRIPFAFEYILPVAEATNLYLGGGPDIIHTANDLTDTNVGMHLGARLHYAFTENWGAAVEAGYMWGSVKGDLPYEDGKGSRVKLDNAYITPQVSYTF